MNGLLMVFWCALNNTMYMYQTNAIILNNKIFGRKNCLKLTQKSRSYNDITCTLIQLVF